MRTEARLTPQHAPDGGTQMKSITKLYHGTSDRYLNAILSQGIIPRGRRKGNWQKVPSRPSAVYLTTVYPFYFAIHATQEEAEKAVVFEVDFSRLDKVLLEPDEDFIAESIADVEKRTLEEVNPEVRRQFSRYSHLWPESLAGMGCCAYRGAIPASAITRYCLFESHARTELMMMMLDPTISIFNYVNLWDKYEGLVQWMFGDRDDLPYGRRCPFPSAEQLQEYPKELRDKLREAWEYRQAEARDRTGIEVVTPNGDREEVAA